jgi:D-amino-acid dehydrogenase
MVLKRGYHTHLTPADQPLRPYLDAEHGYVAAPMKAGLRVTSGAELTAQHRPQRPHQLEHAVSALRELMPDVTGGDGEIWHGHRPCMPSMLPRIGKAENHTGLWFNFGHGHQGFTLGPTTGHILADKMAAG